jgi:hypothetical protein
MIISSPAENNEVNPLEFSDKKGDLRYVDINL